jgi:hypothetical protein
MLHDLPAHRRDATLPNTGVERLAPLLTQAQDGVHLIGQSRGRPPTPQAAWRRPHWARLPEAA